MQLGRPLPGDAGGQRGHRPPPRTGTGSAPRREEGEGPRERDKLWMKSAGGNWGSLVPGQAEEGEAAHPGGARTRPLDSRPSVRVQGQRAGGGADRRQEAPAAADAPPAPAPAAFSACAWSRLGPARRGGKDGDWSGAASQLSTRGSEPAPPPSTEPWGRRGAAFGQTSRSHGKGKAGESQSLGPFRHPQVRKQESQGG